MGREERRLTDTPRTDGLMRRIDYLRQTQTVPMNGLNAPPGENPYEKDFGILSLPEFQRILAKFPPLKRGHPGKAGESVINRTDIARAVGFPGKNNRGMSDFLRFCKGNLEGLGRVRLRRISRVLMMLDSGQLVKREGKMVYLDPESPEVKEKMRARTLTFSVCFGSDGRARIVRGEPPPMPKQMPRLFADFKLPGK